MSQTAAMPVNELGQPIGPAVPGWTARSQVGPVTLVGEHCRVEPLAKHHLPGLYDALALRSPASTWTYLKDGPFDGRTGFYLWLSALADDRGFVPHAVCDPTGGPLGIACYLRENAAYGTVEVGSIAFSAALQRTTVATEAMYLMARHAFELGYRRYEWKCDALNDASRRAAERLGFVYEGTFRQDVVYKGRNRDTAWFSITDEEWPVRRAILEAWLAPANFDEQGRQRRSMAEIGVPDSGTGLPRS